MDVFLGTARLFDMLFFQTASVICDPGGMYSLAYTLQSFLRPFYAKIYGVAVVCCDTFRCKNTFALTVPVPVGFTAVFIFCIESHKVLSATSPLRAKIRRPINRINTFLRTPPTWEAIRFDVILST